MKRLITLFALMVIALQLNAEKRVYWLHGLNSDETFWQRYRSEISNRYAGEQFYWSGNNSLTDASNKLNTTINKSTYSAVLIGHSAGGLVARSAQLSNSRIRGIITVGTPNQGAPVVNAMKSGSYKTQVNHLFQKGDEAVEAVTTGLGAIIFAVPVVGPLVTCIICCTGNIVWNEYSGPLQEQVDDLIQSFLSQQSVNDMLEESNYIKNLNSRDTNIPIVNIYGQEDSWEAVRLFSSLKNNEKVVSMANTSDNGHDTQYVEVLKNLTNALEGVVIGEACAIGVCAIAGIFCPPLFVAIPFLSVSMSDILSVNGYLATTFHNDYSTLIGASHKETRTYTTGWWFWRKTHTETVTIFEPHDGLIPVKSTQLPSNVKNVIHRDKDVIKGANHMEMSANKKIKDRLNEILRDGYEGRSFKQSE